MSDSSTNPNIGNIPSLSRQRLANQIADVLRNQMLLGDLNPGQNIPERETASALGVSRTPLREALLILEGEGMVEMLPARSPVVVDPSIEELTHLLLIQSSLEALAGESACEEMTAAEYTDIEALHQEMVDTSEDAASIDFFATDMKFHTTIVAATKNQSLIKTHAQYNSRLWRIRFMASRRKLNRASSLRDHANIVDGLKNRDKEQTSNAMKEHLRTAIKKLDVIFADRVADNK